jgi:hypothetical protein
LIDTLSQTSNAVDVLASIKAKQIWQGSLIAASSVNGAAHLDGDPEWWIVASQACNVYNQSLELVPVVELVAARSIEKLDPSKVKGDNPRTLHVRASGKLGQCLVEVDIQRRVWISRCNLAAVAEPEYHIQDTPHSNINESTQVNPLDLFVGWMARSYTRVALPDEFNLAMSESKIAELLKKKLTSWANQLYGMYVLVEHVGEDDSDTVLGLLPPPYQLSILLISNQDVDPEPIREELKKALFDDLVQAPGSTTSKTTRSELARLNNIRITRESIEARTESDVTLTDLRGWVRYTFLDHMSSSYSQ